MFLQYKCIFITKGKNVTPKHVDMYTAIKRKRSSTDKPETNPKGNLKKLRKAGRSAVKSKNESVENCDETEEIEEMFFIDKITEKRNINGCEEFLVIWTAGDSSWEPRNKLEEDGIRPDEYFEESINNQGFVEENQNELTNLNDKPDF